MAINYGDYNEYATPSYDYGNSNSGGGGSSGGGGGGSNPFGDFNSEDFAASGESSSKSYTGLPSWSSDWIKQWWPSYNQGMSQLWAQYIGKTGDKTNLNNLQGQDLSSLVANLGRTGTNLNSGVERMRSDFGQATTGLEGYIDRARQLMPQQYLEQMKLYNERAQQPVLNRLSNRGILNSSVTGGALADVETLGDLFHGHGRFTGEKEAVDLSVGFGVAEEFGEVCEDVDEAGFVRSRE